MSSRKVLDSSSSFDLCRSQCTDRRHRWLKLARATSAKIDLSLDYLRRVGWILCARTSVHCWLTNVLIEIIIIKMITFCEHQSHCYRTKFASRLTILRTVCLLFRCLANNLFIKFEGETFPKKICNAEHVTANFNVIFHLYLISWINIPCDRSRQKARA